MIELLDAQRRFIAPVDTALSCGYTQTLNDMPTAEMTLASRDALCAQIIVPSCWLRIDDEPMAPMLFRFKSVDCDYGEGGTCRYTLEGAACTLLDDLLIGCHELGGTDLSTRWVIEYILARQTVPMWQLGTCDFEDFYQYNFEDVSLLEALMSLGEVLTEDYEFQFDAVGEPPWTVNLVRLSSETKSALTAGRNMTALTRHVDGRVVTRLVGRGYGEGDNQLTIASVNGGRDYLDADTMGTWGVRVGVHADRRQTDPQTLMARMAAILEAGKNPQVSYEADALDLYRLTGERFDSHRPGDMVTVLDEALGSAVRTRVTKRTRPDILCDPAGVQLTFSSGVRDTADELNEVLDKIGVQELYSQGATNMYSMQISDSADQDHALEMNFYVPGNVVRINSCILRWKLERFRSYATMAESGGGSTRTSQEGGGATVSIPQVTTSVGVTYSSQPMDTEGSFVSLTGGPKDYLGAAKMQTGSAGTHSHNMTHTHIVPSHTHKGVAHSHNMTHTHAIAGHSHTFTGETVTYSIGHNHSLAGDGALTTGAIYSGNKSIQVTPRGGVEGSDTLWTTSPYNSVGGSVISATGEATAGTEGSGSLWTSSPYDAVEGSAMAATGENGAHTHNNDHVHDIPHVHNIAHQHVIPSMSFELTPHRHTVTIPEHTHELVYGIYEGARAETIGIEVDGETIPADEYGESLELDVAKYLSKDSDGRIVRGSWHSVAFTPDSLTRVTANLFFQVFIQSRGAGDY